jgi:hypothetical protein
MRRRAISASSPLTAFAPRRLPGSAAALKKVSSTWSRRPWRRSQVSMPNSSSNIGPPRMAEGSLGLPPKPSAMRPLVIFSRRSRMASAEATPSQRVSACSMPGSFLMKRAAGGNHQGIVGKLALVGDDGAPAILQTGHAAGDEFDGMVLEEGIEGEDQVLALAQAGGHPDQAGQVDEFRLGRDQADAGIGRAAAQLAHCGEGAEAGAEDDDVGRSRLVR